MPGVTRSRPSFWLRVDTEGSRCLGWTVFCFFSCPLIGSVLLSMDSQCDPSRLALNLKQNFLLFDIGRILFYFILFPPRLAVSRPVPRGDGVVAAQSAVKPIVQMFAQQEFYFFTFAGSRRQGSRTSELDPRNAADASVSFHGTDGHDLTSRRTFLMHMQPIWQLANNGASDDVQHRIPSATPATLPHQ
ncbi:uncharacterized protein BDV17DRAFT_257684 [Aspergillus undulatus]|uniref:uncharacterized protein n=1 Tax=Aspergillus undulatus TaxID=1810928 RepID=UPI003CCE14C8